MNHEKLLPQKIASSDLSTTLKVIQLFAIAMANYRQPYGELAIDALKQVVPDDVVTAIFFISGLSIGVALKDTPWGELVKELEPDYSEEEAKNFNKSKNRMEGGLR